MATNKKKLFRHKWLKGSYVSTELPFFCFWSLPKKHIPRAVDRNRLRRWGRENLRALELTSRLIIRFLPVEKGFYKNLRRKEFDNVFFRLLEEIQKSLR